MKRALGWVVNIIIVWLLLVVIAFFVLPQFGSWRFDAVLSGSMEPAIKTGALIVITKVAPNEVQVGDIIGFKVAGMETPICHRVIEIVDTEEGVGFRTKGDANEDPDTWVVEPENLIGKVAFHLSWLGYLAKFVKTPYGFGLLLGLPATMIIAMELRSLFWPKPTRRKRPKLRQKPKQFPAYLAIIVGLVLIGALWGMAARNSQERTLASFAQRSEEANQPLYVSQRTMENKGMMPLVICLSSEDETVSFSEDYFRLSPGEQKEIEIRGDSETAVIKTASFFPLLPQKTLYQLFTWDSGFAPLIAAVVWVLPLTVISFLVLRRLSAKPKLMAKYIKDVLHGQTD